MELVVCQLIHLCFLGLRQPSLVLTASCHGTHAMDDFFGFLVLASLPPTN